MTVTLDWIVKSEIKMVDGYDNKRVGYSWRNFQQLWDATIWEIRR